MNGQTIWICILESGIVQIYIMKGSVLYMAMHILLSIYKLTAFTTKYSNNNA